MMENIIILYDENNFYEKESLFENKNALELTREAFEKINFNSEVKIEILKDCQNLTELLEKICEKSKEFNSKNIIFSFADCPFINKSLTEELFKTHIKYQAEYTFADGYPLGFSPEILNVGTVNILKELSKTQEIGKKSVERESLFNLIKADINSFEIESVLSETDFRIFRFAFHCGKKENFLACKQLFLEKKSDDVEDLSKTAAKSVKILKTVPSFYNIQICDSINQGTIFSPYEEQYKIKNKISPFESKINMSFENFSNLISKIADFSEESVINLSGWGEPLNHPEILKIIEKVLSYEGLSIYLETDGINVTDDFCIKLQEILNKSKKRKNNFPKMMIGILLDSFSKEKYQQIHKNGDFEKANEAIIKLEKILPKNVYPVFTRINENEDELESFFRKWNKKESSSCGECIINKYENFAGLLPERKPADLSPLERNPCWHLRRDMTILSNGDVPLCRICLFGNICGNVFQDSLENIWNRFDECLKEHIEEKYNDICRKCDEYYTFNF